MNVLPPEATGKFLFYKLSRAGHSVIVTKNNKDLISSSEGDNIYIALSILLQAIE